MQFTQFNLIDPRFDTLFRLAKEVTPYLAGEVAPVRSDGIALGHNEAMFSQELYQALAKNYPEAGNVYWLTRTWELLCWQPIFLGFISVYQMQAIPPMERIAQYKLPMFTTGFSFPGGRWETGEHAELIEKVAIKLQQLFTAYREQMGEWTRIRPGFTNHLIADGVLENVARQRLLFPEMRDEQVMAEAKLWLNAFNLSHDHLHSYRWDQTQDHLVMIRQTCCQAHRCDDKNWCGNCPKTPENKTLAVYS